MSTGQDAVPESERRRTVISLSADRYAWRTPDCFGVAVERWTDSTKSSIYEFDSCIRFVSLFDDLLVVQCEDSISIFEGPVERYRFKSTLHDLTDSSGRVTCVRDIGSRQITALSTTFVMSMGDLHELALVDFFGRKQSDWGTFSARIAFTRAIGTSPTTDAERLPLWDCCWSPSRNGLLAGFDDGSVILFFVDEPRRHTKLLPPHPARSTSGACRCIDISPDRNLLMVIFRDMSMTVFRTSLSEGAEPILRRSGVESAAFSTTRVGALCFGTKSEELSVWDGGRVAKAVAAHGGFIIAFHGSRALRLQPSGEVQAVHVSQQRGRRPRPRPRPTATEPRP